MPRSHPPTLLTRITRTLREECKLSPGVRILLAVSGGSDSMALLHALAHLRDKLKFQLSAFGVDHGLRLEAGAELDIAEAFAMRLSVPLTRAKVAVRPGSNLQARAREARYALLWAELDEGRADLLATAHHANDRSETVLERLLRGAGPRGMAVLPAHDGRLIRPMIRADKSDVLRHVARHAVPFSQDPSNADPRFLRVRIRNELLPLLVQLSPGISGHLNALADQLAAGDPPTVRGVDGEPVTLRRAQIDQIRRAVRQGRKTLSLRVAGGLEVRLQPASGQLLPARATRDLRKNRKTPAT